jgi:hypothetical protein
LKLLLNSIDLEADDLHEAKRVNRKLLLRRQLRPVLADFDVVLIDTPPAVRAATVNALVVANSVIIPIDSSSFALLGINQSLRILVPRTCSTGGRISTKSSASRSRISTDKVLQVTFPKTCFLRLVSINTHSDMGRSADSQPRKTMV